MAACELRRYTPVSAYYPGSPAVASSRIINGRGRGLHASTSGPCLTQSSAPSHRYGTMSRSRRRRQVDLQCRASAAGERAFSTTIPATPGSPLYNVLTQIDELNKQDPRVVEWHGQQMPYELAYSLWMTEWILRLVSTPSDELLIAARGQHVERWKVPRSSYPEGRASYLRWREDLKRMHSSRVAGIMAALGYSAESQQRVQRLMLKQALKEPEGQSLEDALCLVFLQYQFEEFRQKESEEKMIGILRKTWGKMGEGGRAAALQLPLGPEEAALVGKALQGA